MNFTNNNLNGSSGFIFAWTQHCANDVVSVRGTAVHEPATLLFLGLGLCGMAAVRRRLA